MSPDLPWSAEQADALLRTLVQAHAVTNVHQHFVWLRLHLHRFVPHDLALCDLGETSTSRRGAHVLHSIPIEAGLLAALQRSGSSFWRQLREAWQCGDGRPMALDLAQAPWCETDEGRGLLALGLDRVALHGCGPTGGPGCPSLHGFIGREAAWSETTALAALGVCLPSLHFAAVRAFAARDPERTLPASPAATSLLSEREVEVLQAVREARHNAEIGLRLGISPLTVKNHLRNIMRKLGVSNRAQAVGVAMSRGVLR